MALTLNTSDPLYPALSYLFAVDDDNAVKELRTNLALTVNSKVLLPNSTPTRSSTAPYGRSFRTAAGTGPYDFPGGVSFSPILANTNGPISVFIALNRYNGNSNHNLADMIGGSGPLVRIRTGDKLTSAVYPGVPTTGASTTGSLTTAENTICLTRNDKGANSVFIYLNGTIDPAFAGGLSNASNQFGVTDPPQNLSSIGGFQGASWVSADFVYIAIFVGRVLTAADVSRLHASLTGGNAFALVSGAGGGGDTTPPTLTGAITASAVTSTSYTLAWPAGSDNVGVTGYEYSLNGGTSYTSVGNVLTTNVSGRTPGATDAVRVRAFDAAGNRSTPPLALAVTLAGGGGSGSVQTDVISNGSGSVLAATPFSYSYFAGGRLGSLAGITPREGTVTSDANGRCTISGLPTGSGILLLANRVSSAATDNVYYQAVTVA